MVMPPIWRLPVLPRVRPRRSAAERLRLLLHVIRDAAAVLLVILVAVFGWHAGRVLTPIVVRWEITLTDLTNRPPPPPTLPPPPAGR